MKLVSVETTEKSVCKMTFSATAEDRLCIERKNKQAVQGLLYVRSVSYTHLLAALAALSAQCSKVGSNLNQLARHFNLSLIHI